MTSLGSDKKKKFIYIGSFPPPLGGVTVKNSLLYREISGRTNVVKIDMHKVRKGDAREAGRFIRYLFFDRSPLLIGLSKSSRRRLTNCLYLFQKRRMERSVLIVMGGSFDAGKRSVKRNRFYRSVLVETEAMVLNLSEAGIDNVSLFPNCRKFGPIKQRAINYAPLRLVFFSIVQEMKGIFVAMDAVCALRKKGFDIKLDIWGHLDSRDKDRFLSRFEKPEVASACSYKGVFSSDCDDVQTMLGEYDAMLLPSSWETEGVPGAVIEAKGASLPCIVSEKIANSGVVKNGVDGLVLSSVDVCSLEKAIRYIDEDRQALLCLQNGAAKSAEKYDISKYVEGIFDCVDV